MFLFWVCVLSKYLDAIKICRCLWDHHAYPEKNLLGRSFKKEKQLSEQKNGIFDHHMPIKFFFSFLVSLTKKKEKSFMNHIESLFLK